MLKYLLQGLIFGLAYVAPIGTQNLYVINTAIIKSKLDAFKVALITTFFDISLAIACFFGIGMLIERFFIIKKIILFLGSTVVTYIGIGLLRSTAKISEGEVVDSSLLRTIFTCFAVTWFNPQAIIDGSLLLGGFRASLPGGMSKYFILGVCSASFLWFNFVAAFITKFKNKLISIIKFINIACGIVLIFYGIRLGHSFLKLIL